MEIGVNTTLFRPIKSLDFDQVESEGEKVVSEGEGGRRPASSSSSKVFAVIEF